MSDTALPPVYFGRIDANWNSETRQLLWEKGYFAVMFDNDGKVDPEIIARARDLRSTDPKSNWFEAAGYTTRYGVEAIERMQRAVDDSALVFVDFRGIGGDHSVLVGRADGPLFIEDVREAYTKDSRKGQASISHYKCFRLADAKKMKLDPVLAALRPRQSTFTAWPSAAKRVSSTYRGESLPRTVDSLTPGQLEAVCFEFMRAKDPELKLLLPLGRTLPDVDILGWRGDGGKVAAQVTHLSSRWRTVLNKAKRLAKSPEMAVYIMFASEDALRNAATKGDWPSMVKPVSVEAAFKHVLAQAPDFIDAML